MELNEHMCYHVLLQNVKVDQLYGIVSSLTATPKSNKLTRNKAGQSQRDADVRQTLFWQILLCER